MPPSGLISADSRIVIACLVPPTYEWSYTFLALAVRLPGADPVRRAHAVFSTLPPRRLWAMTASMPPSLDTETCHIPPTSPAGTLHCRVLPPVITPAW